MDDEIAIADAKQMPDGMLVAVYERTRSKRLEMDKRVAEVKNLEEIYKEELIFRMVTLKIGALAATEYLAKLSTKEIPTPTDWGKIRGYIVEHGAWELMQNRLSTAAVAERWEAGEEVPGVGRFKQYNVSISKL